MLFGVQRAEIKTDDGGNGRQFRQVYGTNARDDAVYLAVNGDADDSAVCTCCSSICQSVSAFIAFAQLVVICLPYVQ